MNSLTGARSFMSSIIQKTVLVLLLAIPATVFAEDAVRWAPSVEMAKQIAAAKNQLVLIHFYGDNCPPCRRLEANVFSQASFAQAVEQNFVPVKVNGSQERELAQEFGVDRWPQDVIATPSGQVVYRMISPQDQARYTTVLAQVSAKMNPNAAPGNTMIAQAANSSPIPQTPTQSASPAPEMPAGPSIPSRYSSFTSNGNSAPAASPQPSLPSMPPQPSYGQANTSRFAAGGSAPDQTAPSVGPSQSRFASGMPTPNMAPSQPQPSMSMQANREPAPPVTPPQQQPAPPAAEPQAPKFAMDGYCPVTLVEQMKWQKGDPRWGARHQGQVFLFSSQAEQQKFLANPNRFAPVMSGIDPVVFLGNGKVVPGDRRFGLTYHGTVYLFSSEESLQAFWNEPQRFSSMIQQAMASQNMHR